MIINTLLAQQSIGGTLNPDSLKYDHANPAVGLSSLFSNLFGMFTFITGLAFLIYFIIGALNWTTAGGDAQKVEKAGKQITNALTGLIIVVAAYSITTIIGTVLGFDILNPTNLINNLGPKP